MSAVAEIGLAATEHCLRAGEHIQHPLDNAVVMTGRAAINGGGRAVHVVSIDGAPIIDGGPISALSCGTGAASGMAGGAGTCLRSNSTGYISSTGAASGSTDFVLMAVGVAAASSCVLEFRPEIFGSMSAAARSFVSATGALFEQPSTPEQPKRRMLSAADIELFDKALFASMKLVHKGRLVEG
jgi:hypothetical protein